MIVYDNLTSLWGDQSIPLQVSTLYLSLLFLIAWIGLLVVLETTSEVIFEEEIFAARTFEEQFEICKQYFALRSLALGLGILFSWID